VHEVARVTLILTTLALAAALLLGAPKRPEVTIQNPQAGYPQDTCQVEVLFNGKPAKDHQFVLATRQGGARYYFEGSLQRQADGSQWSGKVQLGSANRGLKERYDILIFQLPREDVEYLSTTRQDEGDTNTWWASPWRAPASRGSARSDLGDEIGQEGLAVP
jgi:hypothetical protein